MRALLFERTGDPLRGRLVPRPEPAHGEVLVRVVASAVNPLDLKIRAGEAAHARVEPPMTLGIDLAGIVAEVGADVDTFRAGDRVYGMTGGVGAEPGALAEYSVVDADLLAHAPATLSLREASALPLASISAWEALVDRASVGPGDRLLVHGGAGGVGSVAVQLGRARGAEVWETGSARSANAIRKLGAAPIDRGTPVENYVESATGGRGFDVVFDTVGGAVLDDSFAAVRRYSGRVVSILGWGVHSLAPLSFRGASYSGVFTLLPLLTGEGRAHHGEILGAIAELVDRGAILPTISPDRYDLATAESAHDAARSGGSGRIVIDISQEER
jgi:NADPH:quinone reductase-like Zn-dependent oxidoreductase